MKARRKMSEIIDTMYDYAKAKKKTVFSKEEIIEAVGKDGMRALLKWDVLEYETSETYKLSGLK